MGGDDVQGGLTAGEGGVADGVGRGGRPCWVRTIVYASDAYGRKSGTSQDFTKERPWSM